MGSFLDCAVSTRILNGPLGVKTAIKSKKRHNYYVNVQKPRQKCKIFTPYRYDG